MTSITLPWPMSTNALYRSVDGRAILSKAYRDWQQEAGLELMRQRPKKFAEPVTVSIDLCPPTKRAYDLDNRFKCVLDLLKKHGVIIDDNSKVVREITAREVESGPPCLVSVALYSIERAGR